MVSQGYGHCLENEPKIIKFEEYKKLASIQDLNISFDLQCKLEYGANATNCLDVQIIEGQCELLFCQSDPSSDDCIGNFVVADNTKCSLIGKDLTAKLGRCKGGTCLQEETFDSEKPVDGDWSNWSDDWSPCSHECNGGIQFKERFCNNPVPKNNGKFCLGQRKIFKTCNLQPCETSENFYKIHNEICTNLSAFSDSLIQDIGQLQHFFLPEEPCKIFCIPENDSNVFVDALQKVPDGTRCSPFTKDVCIYGICNVRIERKK